MVFLWAILSDRQVSDRKFLEFSNFADVLTRFGFGVDFNLEHHAKWKRVNRFTFSIQFQYFDVKMPSNISLNTSNFNLFKNIWV